MHDRSLQHPWRGFRRQLLVGVVLLQAWGLAHAASPGELSDAERALLPKYCGHTQEFSWTHGRKSDQADYWARVMGPNYSHIHHYCWALTYFNRARRASTTANDRISALEAARLDFEYVVNACSPDFVLLPEVYTRLGEVEILRGQPNRANAAFQRARQLKPDYWPPYFHWAEFLSRVGQRAEALKVVTQGLEQSPDAKVLQNLYQTLGGKLSEMPKAAPPVAAPEGGEPAGVPAATDAGQEKAAASPAGPEKAPIEGVPANR